MFIFVPWNFLPHFVPKPQFGAAESQVENGNFEAASEDFYANLDINTAFETYREVLYDDVNQK